VSNNKNFQCARPSCTGIISFDLKKVIKNIKNNILECNVCNKKWKLSIERSTCCRVFVRFSSIESSNKKAIVKIKSFNK